MFKLACLAYQPSNVNYRGMVVDRKTMIKVRRGLVDKITNLLPTCDLFKDHAIYPRRYFDDLMVEESLHANPPSATNMEKSTRVVSLSPTHVPSLNQNSSHFLPEVGGVERLPFGIGQKNDYQAASISNSQQFFDQLSNQASRLPNMTMTIDVNDVNSSRREMPAFMPMLK